MQRARSQLDTRLCNLCGINEAAALVDVRSDRLLPCCHACSVIVRRGVAAGLSWAEISDANERQGQAERNPELALAPQGRLVIGSPAIASATASSVHSASAAHLRRSPRALPPSQLPAGGTPRAGDAGPSHPRWESIDASPGAMTPARLPAAGDTGLSRDSKMCNLCARLRDISQFSLAGTRRKPYCVECMRFVRRGMQHSIRVAEMRASYTVGGYPALAELVGLRAAEQVSEAQETESSGA
jgi:hypothetical protein